MKGECAMNIRVLYHSTTGNTKKVAEAIAKSLGVKAEPIRSAAPVSDADVLFLGDGVYGGTVHKETRQFIETLTPEKVKKAAVFSTYGGQDKSVGVLLELLKARGIRVSERTFSCRGKAWYFFNRKHPTDRELEEAGEFAKRVVG
jgi:flavodoxin